MPFAAPHAIRRLLVLAAAIFAVLAGTLQTSLGLGQTPEEFAADSDATLRVAGYAFSIWGVIYAWLLVYAARQALPRTPETRLLRAFGWPSLLALLGIGWWIVAAAVDAELMTIVLIFASSAALLVPLLRDARLVRAEPSRSVDRWTVIWPLGLLAGWLSIASLVNLLTVLTGNGDLPAVLPPLGWGLLAVAVAALLAIGVTWRARTLSYPIPIAWGLVAVFAAEQADDLPLAVGALVAALLIATAAVLLVFRRP
jgi:hypothetical protein